MLNFREILPSDRDLLHAHYYQAEGHGSEYSFVNLYLWGEQRVAFADDLPLILSRFGRWYSYLMPLHADREKAIALLREDAQARGIPFRLFGLLPEEAAWLQARYPQEFSYRPTRDSFDYVYDIDRLAELHGKKLQAKRNHCNRFEETYPDYRVLPLTQELLPRCEAFAARWYATHEQDNPDTDYAGEKAALSKAFSHFDELHMVGILIETTDGDVAFSMGNRIREDTFDVNFEKALAEVNGAYPLVNREFARRIRAACPEIRFLNREDDMGIEGLRRAKESYFPDLLLEKTVAEAL
ncbi:MAG: DUF2156 domain-containing protein [Faecousia sp.]